MRKKLHFRYWLSFIILIVLLLVFIFWNINSGSISILLKDIFQILFHKNGDETAYNIVWEIRLPRILAAVILGGALSVSGFLLQTFFGNPIAGPFVLGISSGAKMFLAITMIFLLKFIPSIPMWIQMAASFAGSLLSLMYVLVFAKKVKSMSMLLVIGIMISYICSAVTDFSITFANDSQIANLTHWALGSFSGSSWSMVKAACILVIPVTIVTFFFSKPIGAYQLGEGYAKSLGINIPVFRIVIITLSSLLSSCVTALAGPISFVGIAVPHITRLMLKTAKPVVVIPACFLCGSVFCMFCDLIARTILSPSELAIGTVTAVFGAPVVIWLMIKKNQIRE